MIKSISRRAARGGRDSLREGESAGEAAPFLLLPAICYYLLLITGAGTTGPLEPVPYGLTFNSMLLHLLQGRFDVDPAAIGYEGYVRDGAVYAYFGIYPALFRVLFLPLPDFAATDFTRLSCLAANSLMSLFKLLSALVVWRSAAAVSRRPLLLSLFIATILLSGPQIQFLRPSIYQEVMLWADVFAAAFVLLVLYGSTREEGFTPRLLMALALVAGLCLLTRVSTALGLYLAAGFLWLWCAWPERGSRELLTTRLLSLSWPVVILTGFVVLTGIVNRGRWGNPLVFVDLSRSLLTEIYPAHYHQLAEYHEFNLLRLGFGLLYYFLPLWVLHDGSGHLLWSDFVQRTMDAVELPPSSILISDPLLTGLALYGAIGMASGKGVPHRTPIALAASGLVVPGVLMLIAIGMTFRYRMEFYPLFELFAFIGFWRVLAAPPRCIGIVFGGATLVSILATHLLWLLYMLSPFGMAAGWLGQNSIVEYYQSLLR